MTTETPKGLCAWCSGPVPASRGTKPRRYCKDGCKQRAYEARKLAGQLKAVRDEEAEKRAAVLARAYTKGRREGADARKGTSRDVAPVGEASSRDVLQGQQAGLFEGDWVRSPEEVDAQLAELEERRRAR